VYHIYNRLGGGLRLFSDDDLAGVFVGQLREAVERDGVSRWSRRVAIRRAADPEFATSAQALDQAASEEP
jgi:hypothetical protein